MDVGFPRNLPYQTLGCFFLKLFFAVNACKRGGLHAKVRSFSGPQNAPLNKEGTIRMRTESATSSTLNTNPIALGACVVQERRFFRATASRQDRWSAEESVRRAQ